MLLLYVSERPAISPWRQVVVWLIVTENKDLVKRSSDFLVGSPNSGLGYMDPELTNFTSGVTRARFHAALNYQRG